MESQELCARIRKHSGKFEERLTFISTVCCSVCRSRRCDDCEINAKRVFTGYVPCCKKPYCQGVVRRGQILARMNNSLLPVSLKDWNPEQRALQIPRSNGSTSPGHLEVMNQTVELYLDKDHQNEVLVKVIFGPKDMLLKKYVVTRALGEQLDRFRDLAHEQLTGYFDSNLLTAQEQTQGQELVKTLLLNL